MYCIYYIIVLYLIFLYNVLYNIFFISGTMLAIVSDFVAANVESFQPGLVT